MLRPIELYVEDINKRIVDECYYNIDYQYYFGNSNFKIKTDEKDTYKKHSFASIKKCENKDGKDTILGVIQLEIDRDTYSISNMSAFSFGRRDPVFGMDCMQAIHNCFLVYRFNKLKITVIEGNPAIKSYMSLMKRIGGRQVGVFEKECVMLDGKFRDMILLECLRSNFKPMVTRENSDWHIQINKTDLDDLIEYQKQFNK